MRKKIILFRENQGIYQKLTENLFYKKLTNNGFLLKENLDMAIKYRLFDKFDFSGFSERDFAMTYYYVTSYLFRLETIFYLNNVRSEEVESILSLASGYWYDSLALALFFNNSHNITGYDIDPQACQKAEEFLAKFRLDNSRDLQIAIHQQDIADTKDATQYDLITFFHPHPSDWIQGHDISSFINIIEIISSKLADNGNLNIIFDANCWLSIFADDSALLVYRIIERIYGEEKGQSPIIGKGTLQKVINYKYSFNNKDIILLLNKYDLKALLVILKNIQSKDVRAKREIVAKLRIKDYSALDSLFAPN